MSRSDLVARYYDRVFRFTGTERLLRGLQPRAGDHVLDVGGGTGRVSGTFGGQFDVVVCDPAPAMLNEAQGKGLHACAGVAENLPFRDASFARIILIDAFHHLGDQGMAAAELWRLLQPGGRLVVEEPDIHRLVIKIVAFLERLLRMRSSFFSLPDMVCIFAASGAHITQTEVGPGTNVRLMISR